MSVPLGKLVRVACAQIAPRIADPTTNRELVREAIIGAVASNADVIVLPELATTGYYMTSGEARALAEPVEGPSVSTWIQALSGSEAVVIGGFCEVGAGDKPYNSAALVSGQGVLAVYRKAHLWAEEPLLFAVGSVMPPVVETRFGRIGVGICYDLFFPEVTRSLALRGAQLLALPTNSPWDKPREVGAINTVDGIGHVVARSAAYLNRVFVAVCDRHGDERGHAWTARSSIIGPEGDFRAGPVSYESAAIYADCDLQDADQKIWVGTKNDALADRRPELYEDLARRGPRTSGD